MPKPRGITTRKIFPYDELSPAEFERLCLWLVRKEGYSNVQHFGDTGGDQGRDIVAYKRTDKGEALTYFQCKRYKKISRGLLTSEIDKYLELIASDPKKKPEKIIFVTNASVSPAVREAVEKYCAERDLACEFWARTELDMRVKEHPEIISEFFDAAAAVVLNYPALKDYAYDFTDLIASTTRWFVGREYVFDLLAKFDADRKGRYFRIIADAGLGKTALAAEIARRYKAPSFFFNERSGLTRPDQCLNHLSVLLIARFGLNHDYLPPRAGDDSSFFSQILAECAERSNGAIWIVIDALDEAIGSPKGANPFLLPDRLPPGVNIVLTQRPGDYPLVTDSSTAVDDYLLGWNDSGQQADINKHLRQQAQRPEVQEALNRAEPPIAIPRFIQVLQNVSEGNFKYLDYVITDIIAREPGFHPLKSDNLPKGLKGYYAQFWARMETVRETEGWSDWNNVFRQVIALLAVAREPVPLEWLSDHSRREITEIRERVLARWRRFLSRSNKGEETWRIVHQSFSDFLAEKLDLPLTHAAVAKFYLQDPIHWNLHKGYANRHLTRHLHLATQDEALFRLVDDRNWYQAQLGADPSVGTYLADLKEAWAAAEETNLALLDHRPLSLLGRELRSALAVASLHSFLKNLPAALPWMFKSGLWNAGNALEVMRQNPRPEFQAESLAAIAPFLSEPELMNALVLVRAMPHPNLQARALETLLPRLTELGREADAFAEALSVSSEWQGVQILINRVMILRRLAPKLSEKFLRKALETVETIKIAERSLTEKGELHPDLFSALGEWDVVSLTRLAQLGYWSEAIEATQHIRAKFWRSRAVASVAPYLPAGVREQLIYETLPIAREIPLSESRAQALAELAENLPENPKNELLREAFQFSAGDWFWRARVLSALSAHLNNALLSDAVEETRKMPEAGAATAAKGLILRLAQLGSTQAALDLLPVIKVEPDRAEVLGSLGAYLPEASLRDALKLVQSMESEESRAEALAGLLPRLSELGHSQEALTFARLIGDEETRAGAVATLAIEMAKLGYPQKALEMARGIELPSWHAWTLYWLACDLDESLVREALSLALTAEEKSHASGSGGLYEDRLWTVRAVTELSARLADLGSSEEALATVRIIHDESDRAEAVAKLVTSLSEPYRSQARRESLTQLRENDSVPVLTAILPHLSETELKECFDIIRSFRLEDSRSDAMSQLVRYAPKPLVWEVMSASDKFEMLSRKLDVRLSVTHRLAELHQFKDALHVIDLTEVEHFQADALERLAKRVPDELVQEILDRAKRIENEQFRARVLLELAKRSNEPQMLEIVKLAQSLKQNGDPVVAQAAIRLGQLGFPERGYTMANEVASGSERAYALKVLARYLPAQLVREAIKKVGSKGVSPFAARLAELGFIDEALQLVNKIAYTDGRLEALTRLAPYFSKPPLADFYQLWRDSLHVPANRTRDDLINAVCVQRQVLVALGGREALEDAAQAIQDTGRWWP